MPPYPVSQQIRSYIDSRDGTPLNGTLKFGQPGQDPESTTVVVYWDVAMTQVAAQPIRVRNGFALRGRTPANVFADGDFSAIARDTRSRLVYTVPNSTDIQLAESIVDTTAADIDAADAGAYYTAPKNLENILQQIGASLAAVVVGALPTGSTFDYCGTTAPTGYVFGSGQTIGNASSGAVSATHQRANADTSSLFVQLWNSSTNTELPIQDSAGSATTRGANAAADFAANKRMPTPDCRGRVRAGKDNMGPSGATASRITSAGATTAQIVGTTLFAAGGVQSHALTSPNEIPSHTHTGPSHTHTGPSHTHTGPSHSHDMTHTHAILKSNVAGSFPGLAVVDGALGNELVGSMNSTTTGASGTGTTSADGTGATGAAGTGATGGTGSGLAHQNTQPTIMFNAIIKL